MRGAVAVITGGASGIGRATAHRLADEGARVVIVDVDRGAGQDVADEVGGLFVHADVSVSTEICRAFEVAEDQLGSVDIAFLSAGVPTGEGDIVKLTDEQLRRAVGINVDGVVFGIRAAVPAMERAGGGAIVCMSSLGGLLAYAGDPIYAATKHAVVGLVRSLGVALGRRGIVVTAMCPGLVETPLTRPVLDRLREIDFPLMQPEEVADAVMLAIANSAGGEAWVCQPGRDPVAFEFRGVPGPRTPGAEGLRPPPGIGV